MARLTSSSAVLLIVDAIYAELLRRGVPIDYSLYNAPHGFREFGVTDPDGYDIAFGQPIGD